MASRCFIYCGELLRCPHKRFVTITKVYIARNNIHTRGINTITSTIAILLTLETLKWELGLIYKHSFATGVFTKLGSMLSGRCRHCSVRVAPDVSGQDHFGTLN